MRPHDVYAVMTLFENEGACMTKQRGTLVFSLGLVMFVMQVAFLSAQSAKLAAAPVPAPILAAKKVFIANDGGEAIFDDPKYGDVDRAYNQFYAAMKTWGRYELAGTPADADLLLEIRLTVSWQPREVLREQSSSAVPYDPLFRLVIRDARTNAVLWGLTEHVRWAILQGNLDKNFDQAMAKLVGDVQALTGQAANPAAKP
jgi:hypothetical protein